MHGFRLRPAGFRRTSGHGTRSVLLSGSLGRAGFFLESPSQRGACAGLRLFGPGPGRVCVVCLTLGFDSGRDLALFPRGVPSPSFSRRLRIADMTVSCPYSPSVRSGVTLPGRKNRWSGSSSSAALSSRIVCGPGVLFPFRCRSGAGRRFPSRPDFSPGPPVPAVGVPFLSGSAGWPCRSSPCRAAFSAPCLSLFHPLSPFLSLGRLRGLGPPSRGPRLGALVPRCLSAS